MNYSAVFWLTLNMVTVLILSFFSMMEMACVSFNKVRLQYYVSKGIKQAVWLNYLLHNPSRLFGTTLIMVNVTMFTGSECAREFHEALGISPDFAPLSQVIIVVIFGELAPMFAARRYAEHVALLGVPIIYFTAKLMTPFLWLLGSLSKIINLLFGGKESATRIFLSREELLKILESKEEEAPILSTNEAFDTVATNILSLHKKDAKDIMIPLPTIPVLPSSATVRQAREILSTSPYNYLPMFHNDQTNIIGIVSPRNLLKVHDVKKARDYVRPPWFITQFTKVAQILRQFQNNNQSVAVVLDQKGLAIGIINLDDIFEEIFGEAKLKSPKDRKSHRLMIAERTFPGSMRVGEFNKMYHVTLDTRVELTLARLVQDLLGHVPEVGESVFIAPFEITIKETSLLDIKSVSVRTKGT